MKRATFYLLNSDKHHHGDGFDSLDRIVCDLAAKHWRNGRSILIFCEDEKQAIRLDEALWITPPGSFVPHNLVGEGPKRGAPIEIIWKKKSNNTPKDLLINLCMDFIDFSITFEEVIDFVPCQDFLKRLARVRYRAFRMAGFNLNTVIWK